MRLLQHVFGADNAAQLDRRTTSEMVTQPPMRLCQKHLDGVSVAPPPLAAGDRRFGKGLPSVSFPNSLECPRPSGVPQAMVAGSRYCSQEAGSARPPPAEAVRTSPALTVNACRNPPRRRPAALGPSPRDRSGDLAQVVTWIEPDRHVRVTPNRRLWVRSERRSQRDIIICARFRGDSAARACTRGERHWFSACPERPIRYCSRPHVRLGLRHCALSDIR